MSFGVHQIAYTAHAADSYFVVSNLADTQADVIRIAGLLRAVESGWQAISVSLRQHLHLAHVTN